MPLYNPTSSALVANSTAITSGTNTSVLFDDSAVLGEDAGLTYTKSSRTLNLGTSTAGGNEIITATLGSELILAFTDANWTLGAGWESPISGAVLNKNAAGLGATNPTVALSLTVGVTYKIVLTFSAFTAGSCYFSIGSNGFGDWSHTFSAAGTYTEYITPTNAGSFFFRTSDTTSRFTVSALSIKALTDGTGDLRPEGNIVVGSPMQDSAGNNLITFQRGFVGINSTNPQSRLSIGAGDIQLDAGYGLSISIGGTIYYLLALDGANQYLAYNPATSSGAGSYYGNSSGSSHGPIVFLVNGSEIAYFKGTAGFEGQMGIGVTYSNIAAWLHLKAGSAGAKLCPLKFSSGTNMTTPEAGAVEYNGRHYLTDADTIRYPLGGSLFRHFANVGNTTTAGADDDLYSDTIAASTLSVNGDKLEAEYGGVFVSSGTATRQIKIWFGGTALLDTGTLTLTLSSAWTVYVTIIRVSATVVRYMISLTTEGAALAAYTAVGELTGLTLSNTNVLKITGSVAGAGGAANDILAQLASVDFAPAP